MPSKKHQRKSMGLLVLLAGVSGGQAGASERDMAGEAVGVKENYYALLLAISGKMGPSKYGS